MKEISEILSYLPTNKIKELETVTQRIIDTQKAEIILLFGSYARGNYKEQRGKDRGRKSDYDILVVTSDSKNKKELRSLLSGVFKDIEITVQQIVETISFVNSNLEETQYFFTDIKREGKILYNTGQYKLADPLKLTPTRRREIAEEDFKMWVSNSKTSFNHSKYAIRDDSFGKAAFELQQVVEMCYTAIEMVFTHYNPHEHNLEELRERVLQFNSGIKEVLPYDTKEQKELFDYLNFAYIGGRYRSKEDFPVNKEQLDYWSKEAKKLLELTETICKERIECLIEIEKNLLSI